MNLSKNLPILSLFIVGLAVCSAANPSDADADRPPNVILIIGDDISQDDFGCYGHPTIRTPHIDALAAGGLRFTNAYLTTSQCSPTRCSVLSGRYPHNTGAPELHMPLPADQPTIAKSLKEVGYYTATAGKWHIGSAAKKPFDRSIGLEGLPGGEEHWIQFLQERPKNKPFFMWFASYDAHRAWDPDPDGEPHDPEDAVIPPYMMDGPGTRDELAKYYDEIQRLDRYVGQVVAELKKQGVYENTMIIFMADNGRPFPRCKTWLYDSGIKTPFIIHWPKRITGDVKGKTSDSLVSAIDVSPTILSAAGAAIPEAMQGVSLRPLFTEPSAKVREFCFAERNWHGQAGHQRLVRWGDYVYIRDAHPETDNLVLPHRGHPSYRELIKARKTGTLTPAQADIFLAPRPAEVLFNVANDPHQLVNLANDPEHAEITSKLQKTLNQWQQETGDTTPSTLTPDTVNRKTWKSAFKGLLPPSRGEIPGAAKNASKINLPGPR